MSALANRRVLVVEDEFLISAMLCDMLIAASAEVVGPAANVSAALKLIEDNPVDGAILDMNLNGQWIDPVAEALARRAIPFVFTTGYGTNVRSQKFGARTIEKPYTLECVEAELALAIAGSAKARSD
ncbi:MAG: response regulator [Tabrizicola sp.]|uniref:response regulator n=1 Tax=Tabrizicola sp. TaxID=2005166 RepID=UPI00273619CE|nr:response regulator [Tabrizicola sp.]MDP3265062.1 response regulator [Tabrizicola sp.]MDP3647395.1 response regulator [Paracoccaceae bacterium]MDZ4066385.1 response regulator [Tabrizicola sp.]